MKNKKDKSLGDIFNSLNIHPQKSTSIEGDITGLCNNVGSVEIPLIKEVINDPEHREVTFLWRSEKILQSVYIRLNRITDKKNIRTGLMRHVPSTDFWILTLKLPASYRGSYSFIEVPQGMSEDDISQLGGRFSSLPGQPDPFNKEPEINIRGFGESVLSLDQAPKQNEWTQNSIQSDGVLTTSYHSIAGHERRVRFYIPKLFSTIPLGLLVLPDAEIWFDRIGITRAIDIAINTGRIAPLAVLGIDNINESDRVKILGGHKEFIIDISRTLLPSIHQENPDIIWAGRSKTILAGQSLGGVTALMAALCVPDTFGTIISHSPSMWWSPERNTPTMFTENDNSWVSEMLLSNNPKDVHIQLAVGSLEGATVYHVNHLHQSLLNSGVSSELSVYTGGHDYAWWRGAIIDGLAGLQ
ncbi:esterase family protein [Salmonella enterica]|uniref:Esterase family protein n=1 Tax=Salmonella enterica TaxID=28901 RepID=A0A3K8Y8N3_SALER|nr:esterase family protein [Salmonella enterica]EBY3697904.1 esterase family protein [Salmonella enterica subsp. enterica serovar Muenchen]ECH9521019.1 esterase family protein [Salmonella enterica subsp. enterica]EDR9393766.1 esterase family protein [Salmonella enterica subsp. enterica serovar Baildon]EEE1667066.1 esterase family protein [Salmonella enterica subsp. houtenae serovar 48:z4,z32:-]